MQRVSDGGMEIKEWKDTYDAKTVVKDDQGGDRYLIQV